MSHFLRNNDINYLPQFSLKKEKNIRNEMERVVPQVKYDDLDRQLN